MFEKIAWESGENGAKREVEEQWSKFKEAVLDMVEEVCGQGKKGKWWSEGIV